jgi:tRNA 2-selenouridine synthase
MRPEGTQEDLPEDMEREIVPGARREPRGATVAELERYDVLIDARSPAEFEHDHIPGAINCPVLDDAERREIGTLYKQVSAFEARKLGAAMVARNIARHLDERFRGQPKGWRPLVYCWRGGMRSGSFVTWLRLVGWDAQQLQGGYKAWRGHVVERLATLAPQLPLRVLCGATGSAKTRVLAALETRGQQVLDLEGLARHRGSVLGALPGVEQPSQKAFETQLADRIARFDLGPPGVGRGREPQDRAAVGARRAAVAAAREPAGRDRGHPAGAPRLPAARLRRARRRSAPAARPARAAARAGAERGAGAVAGLGPARELRPLFAALMEGHYDPLYARSQGRNFARLDEACRVETDDLSDRGIDALAERIATRD